MTDTKNEAAPGKASAQTACSTPVVSWNLYFGAVVDYMVQDEKFYREIAVNEVKKALADGRLSKMWRTMVMPKDAASEIADYWRRPVKFEPPSSRRLHEKGLCKIYRI